MREAQAQRRFDRAESLIKRLVRDNFRELERAFKLGDADGSGSLDATELRNVLFRFDIVLEDEHYAQLLQVSTPDRLPTLLAGLRFLTPTPRCVLLQDIDKDGDGEISYSEFLGKFAKGSAQDKQLVMKLRGTDALNLGHFSAS